MISLGSIFVFYTLSFVAVVPRFGIQKNGALTVKRPKILPKTDPEPVRKARPTKGDDRAIRGYVCAKKMTASSCLRKGAASNPAVSYWSEERRPPPAIIALIALSAPKMKIPIWVSKAFYL